MLVFVGGAAGKFACGALAERLGVIRTVVITEAATGAGILLLLDAAARRLPRRCCRRSASRSTARRPCSTARVADLVSSDRRARSYAIFYTVGIGASALSPFVYGAAQRLGRRAG